MIEVHLPRKECDKTPRLFALDALRGLVIALMALGNTSYFITRQNAPGLYWGSEYPAYRESLALLTQSLAHLAAPGFFFLMGVGMLLFAHSRLIRGWTWWYTLQHFLTRGALLIILQLLVINRVWQLSVDDWSPRFYGGVLFALGSTMIVGSALLWISPRALPGFILLFVVGIAALTPAPRQWDQVSATFSHLLLIPGGDRDIWVNFPILPWLGLVALGMLFGYWLLENPKKAFERGFRLGVGVIIAFLALCYFDGLGRADLQTGSWIDFSSTIKYPPSITFTLPAMGVLLMLLWAFAQVSRKTSTLFQPLVVFGRVPLFFYVAHLILYAVLGELLPLNSGGIVSMIPNWLLGLLILYGPCLWYGRLKDRQPEYSILRFL